MKETDLPAVQAPTDAEQLADAAVANEVGHQLKIARREARGDARAFRIQLVFGHAVFGAGIDGQRVVLSGGDQRLDARGEVPSLAGLRHAGVSRETLQRTVVMHFGVEESAFEALAPKEYVINGKPEPVSTVGRRLK